MSTPDTVSLSTSDFNPTEMYFLLRDSIVPRPIAWVSTINAAGQSNVAPFSFFNVVCPSPPVLGFSCGPRRDDHNAGEGEAKDTLMNIRANGEVVVNLSPEKPKVFAEAFRVLKPGGKFTLSDVVLLRPLPPVLASSAAAYLGCVAGASLKSDYLKMLSAAGFADVQVVGESYFYLGEAAADPIVQTIIEEAKLTPDKIKEVGESIVSIKVIATKAA